MRLGKATFKLRLTFQHTLNPLQVYCRLSQILGKTRALAIASGYERVYRKAQLETLWRTPAQKISPKKGSAGSASCDSRWPRA
jgi:hypothetical protein